MVTVILIPMVLPITTKFLVIWLMSATTMVLPSRGSTRPSSVEMTTPTASTTLAPLPAQRLTATSTNYKLQRGTPMSMHLKTCSWLLRMDRIQVHLRSPGLLRAMTPTWITPLRTLTICVSAQTRALLQTTTRRLTLSVVCRSPISVASQQRWSLTTLFLARPTTSL